ncbi:MAG: PLP-dependent aminotransferase family protein [Aquabacterium sp.]
MSLILAARTRCMNASAIREILKLTERPGVLSLAGGLPAAQAFPLEALARASEKVWRTQGAAAMQYASSEGLPSLRQWVAARLKASGWDVTPEQVQITTGSQQGLDLLGKVLLDPGAPLLVEQPTYLGALQAFSPYEPHHVPWDCDAHGPLPQALTRADLAQGEGAARVAYLVPSFQNPSGRCLGKARRDELAQALREGDHTTLIEDNPYGELWYDEAPGLPISARAPGQCVYVGSLSKVLVPGLRLGFVVTPPDEVPGAQALRAKVLQAKQAADLHTPGFNQRLVLQLLEDGFDLDAHVTAVRERYRVQRDAMAAALQRHLAGSCQWEVPKGGMFFWVRGPAGFDAEAALQDAVAHGVAYVPGPAFFSQAGAQAQGTMRLSFVTLTPEQIDVGVARLAEVVHRGTHGC